jgi:hypothetical protein
MRIALHASGEIGRRAGRILLAERDLTALGLYGHTGRTEDRRTMAIRDLSGFAVLVTDETAPADALGLAAIAAEDGLSAVLSIDPGHVEPELADRFRGRGTTLLTGAGLPGLAGSLARHEAARVDDETGVMIAWTVPGSPLRSGEAVPFPEPVGACWGRKVEQTGAGDTTIYVEVPIEGPWAAAMARVEAGRQRRRIIGVADLAVHLEAIALAAGTLATITGALPPGVWRPTDAGSSYLSHALAVGMDVAAYRT